MQDSDICTIQASSIKTRSRESRMGLIFNHILGPYMQSTNSPLQSVKNGGWLLLLQHSSAHMGLYNGNRASRECFLFFLEFFARFFSLLYLKKNGALYIPSINPQFDKIIIRHISPLIRLVYGYGLNVPFFFKCLAKRV